MDNNFSVKILESYMDIDKLHDDINNKLFHFITKATELVESSEDMYQIEKTIKLNKISLKGYILDSPCCSFLKENSTLCLRKVLLVGFLMHKKSPRVSSRGIEHV